MKSIRILLLSIIFTCPALKAEARQTNTSQIYIPWTKGALETNRYRNLFVEMGYTQKQVDAKLKEVFNDVFNGPNKVYFDVGDSLGYITDIKNHDVRT